MHLQGSGTVHAQPSFWNREGIGHAQFAPGSNRKLAGSVHGQRVHGADGSVLYHQTRVCVRNRTDGHVVHGVGSGEHQAARSVIQHHRLSVGQRSGSGKRQGLVVDRNGRFPACRQHRSTVDLEGGGAAMLKVSCQCEAVENLQGAVVEDQVAAQRPRTLQLEADVLHRNGILHNHLVLHHKRHVRHQRHAANRHGSGVVQPFALIGNRRNLECLNPAAPLHVQQTVSVIQHNRRSVV